MRTMWLIVGLGLMAGCALTEAERAQERARLYQQRQLIDAIMAMPPAERQAYLLWLQLQSQSIPSREPLTISNCQYIAYTKLTICSTTRW